MTETAQTKTTEATAQAAPKKKRVGRPKKSEVKSLTAGNRKAVGRPKGDASILAEYKARMIASPKSKKVLKKVFDIALDDYHKHQAACIKLLMDRLLPVSAFDKDASQGGRSAVNITISGVQGDVKVEADDKESSVEEDVIDAEFEEIKEG